MAMITPERDLEESLVTKLRDLKYEYRTDIRDRATLEANFREKFEALNRVTLTDGEFKRLRDEIVTPDVYKAAQTLRNREAFNRDDGTPLNYTLVNIKDWCKNTFEVVNQLRINTDNSHHRYGVILLINGVPVVQIELKTLGISPRRAMEQVVDYNQQYGTNHDINNFDLYYQDVQQRIKYQQFPNRDLPDKGEEKAKEIANLAQSHGLTTQSLSAFVDTILQRMIFDGEQLTDLMEPLDLGWRERRERELALMAELVPVLNKRAHGRDISGLNAYEQGGAQ